MAEINKKSLGEGVITFAHPYTFEGKEYDGVDLSALDNMTTEQLKESIDYIAGRAEIEVSGNVTKENIARLTGLGVNYVCRVCVHRGCRGHRPAGRVLQGPARTRGCEDQD